jgi:hypothetical protein
MRSIGAEVPIPVIAGDACCGLQAKTVLQLLNKISLPDK